MGLLAKPWIIGPMLCSAGLAAAPATVISSIDLSKPFHTRSSWRFTATQGMPIEDPIMPGDERVPGAIIACLSKDDAKSCQPDLVHAIDDHGEAVDDFSSPHFLNDARIVYPQGNISAPLLLVQMASVHSGNGNQAIVTMAFAYDRRSDRFVVAYRHGAGRNNNEEVRYVRQGPLKGAIISAEPTDHAPFGYWITLNRLTSARSYASVLRYRSATYYGDGNPLAVIDSEMPQIQQRLGLWHKGMPLPLPARCPKPRLVRMELWCS